MMLAIALYCGVPIVLGICVDIPGTCFELSCCLFASHGNVFVGANATPYSGD